MVLAAIYSNCVTAFNESLSKLFYTSFETAVTGRDAARTEQSNIH
jgi:hypothetical protein